MHAWMRVCMHVYVVCVCVSIHVSVCDCVQQNELVCVNCYLHITAMEHSSLQQFRGWPTHQKSCVTDTSPLANWYRQFVTNWYLQFVTTWNLKPHTSSDIIPHSTMIMNTCKPTWCRVSLYLRTHRMWFYQQLSMSTAVIHNAISDIDSRNDMSECLFVLRFV